MQDGGQSRGTVPKSCGLEAATHLKNLFPSACVFGITTGDFTDASNGCMDDADNNEAGRFPCGNERIIAG